MDLELVVREGNQIGTTFPIPEGQIKTVGRATECDIRLSEQGVSRRHCTVENSGRKLRVADLESANGTYINGELIPEGKLGELGVGDQLAVGPTVLECQVSQIPRRPARSREATLAFRDEGARTVLRKVVDTQFPGALETPTRTEDLESLQRAKRNLATAYRISKMLASARDLEVLFRRVIDAILDTIKADRAALLLKSRSDSDEVIVVAARSVTDSERLAEIPVSRTVVKDVLENQMSSLSRDATADARYREGESIIQQQIRSVMCAPVNTDEDVIGVLYADSKSLAGAFTESDLELLALIGNQAGVAIDRARVRDEREEILLGSIRGFVTAIDAKDGYTHRHSERVAAFATRIARELGMSEEEIEVVRLAALLHDIGKVGMPESILNKAGRLTDQEFDEVKRHPVKGYEILKNIPASRFEEILAGVRHHHEKWDGSGYPDGLAARDIPLLGRLLAVADVLDALSSDRSYRPSLGFNRAVEIIEESAGQHFDPAIAAAAIALHARGELEVPAEWLEPGTAPEPTETL